MLRSKHTTTLLQLITHDVDILNRTKGGKYLTEKNPYKNHNTKYIDQVNIKTNNCS